MKQDIPLVRRFSTLEPYQEDVISCWYPQAKQAERLQEGRRVV